MGTSQSMRIPSRTSLLKSLITDAPASLRADLREVVLTVRPGGRRIILGSILTGARRPEMPYIVGIDTGGTFTGSAGWLGSEGDRGADARLRPGEASNSGCQAGARRGGPHFAHPRRAAREPREQRLSVLCAEYGVRAMLCF